MMIKRILKYTLIFFLVLFAVAFAAPFLFKDKIIAQIKAVVNKKMYAKVDFTDAGVSLFRHFPQLAVNLENLQVTGVGGFAADTLVHAAGIDIAMNLMSVIKGDQMKVYSLTLESPRIHAIVSKDGKANWDIMKKDTAAASGSDSTSFNLELEKYTITNGYINYADYKGNMMADVAGINHEGSGDFTAGEFILRTTTRADRVNLTTGGVPYLVDAKADIGADIQVNNTTNTYRFETGNIKLNNLQLFTKGMMQLVTDSTYNIDMTFRAPATSLKEMLSLIPTIYKKDFEKVKTSGTAVFDGFIKGTYGPTQMPAYAANVAVKNGFFQYTDLPKPVRNINITAKVTNPDGITDHTVVDISQGHVEMDNEPFDFRLLVKNPVTNMYVDAAAKGKLDLTRISQFVKLESGTKLSGTVMADVAVKGTIAAAQQQQYEQLYAAGTVAVNALQYAAKDYPDGIRINNLFMTFTPAKVTISDLDGQYKKTNFSANGSVTNMLPYVFRNHTLTGTVFCKADQMNLNDWMGVNTDTTLHNTAASAPFAVPANLNVAVQAEVGRLLYDKLEIQHLAGSMLVKDETVLMNNIKGDALDGSIIISGIYSTRESKSKPDIQLDYNVQGLDVQKTFYAVNTVRKLMPIGQFISGRLSSQLKMSGKLGDNMMPDLTSLTGQGNVLLIEGFLSKFAPLEKLADYLNVSALNDIALRDIKNYFQFTNGMVQVRPFSLRVKEVDMDVSGMHGFNQSLDYLINMKIPRALMGDRGNSLVNNLVTQANSKGIPLSLGETVNLQVKLGGTIKNPSFKTDLRQAAVNAGDQLKQQALAMARSRADSARSAIRDTVQSVKKQVVKDMQDELRKRVFGSRDTATAGGHPADSTKKRLEAAGRGLIQGIFKKKSGG